MVDADDRGPSQHASGNDRDAEPDHSYPQGSSWSNPDGNGLDKPFRGARSQGTADFDGNNGCGNDEDFADDNRGHCAGKGHVAGARAHGEEAVTTAGAQAHDHEGVETAGARAHKHRGRHGHGGDHVAGAQVSTTTQVEADHKVNVCHATGSDTNPFVFITVDRHSVEHEGHRRHAEEGVPPGGRHDIIGVSSAQGCPGVTAVAGVQVTGQAAPSVLAGGTVEVAGVQVAGPVPSPEEEEGGLVEEPIGEGVAGVFLARAVAEEPDGESVAGVQVGLLPVTGELVPVAVAAGLGGRPWLAFASSALATLLAVTALYIRRLL